MITFPHGHLSHLPHILRTLRLGLGLGEGQAGSQKCVVGAEAQGSAPYDGAVPTRSPQRWDPPAGQEVEIGSRDGLGAKQVFLARSECFSGVGGGRGPSVMLSLCPRVGNGWQVTRHFLALLIPSNRSQELKINACRESAAQPAQLSWSLGLRCSVLLKVRRHLGDSVTGQGWDGTDRAGGPGPCEHHPQLPPGDLQLPATSEGVYQTPPHRSMPLCFRLTHSCQLAGTKPHWGARARGQPVLEPCPARSSGHRCWKAASFPRVCWLTLGRGLQWLLQEASVSSAVLPAEPWESVEIQRLGSHSSETQGGMMLNNTQRQSGALTTAWHNSLANSC